jgi:hypothetical protein
VFIFRVCERVLAGAMYKVENRAYLFHDPFDAFSNEIKKVGLIFSFVTIAQ